MLHLVYTCLYYFSLYYTLVYNSFTLSINLYKSTIFEAM